MKHSRPLHTAETEIRRLKNELYSAEELIRAQGDNAEAWRQHAARRDREAEQAAVEHDDLAALNQVLAERCARLQHEVRRLRPRIAWPPRPAPAVPPLAPLRLAHPDLDAAS